MTLREKLKNNSMLEDVENGAMVVARRSSRNCYDTVVHEGYGLGGEALYLSRITDLECDVSQYENDIFVISKESWTRMTKQNLFLRNRESK